MGLTTGDAQSEGARHVELCDLVTHPADYADQFIEVTSEIEFGYHVTLLKDSHCNGVAVWFPTDKVVRPDIDKLSDLRRSSMSGSIRIFGTFRGRFRDNSKQDPQRFFEDGIPFVLIELESVSNLVTRHADRRDLF
jgi:hypothetical protein